MKKKNRGFTLIELLIAVAVLSIMAGVLFQTFVMSSRIDSKARKEETVQDIAKKTLEELKGYSFRELEKHADASEGGKTGTVKIAGLEYTYGPLPEIISENGEEAAGEKKREGFLLKRESNSAGGIPAGGPDGKADYIIQAEADQGVYSAENSPEGGDEDSAYTINHYRMPNIADVSSFQNVVIDPQMLTQNDEVWQTELLEAVNPEEESAAEGDETAEAEDEIIYDEADIRRYLHIDISETGWDAGGGNDAADPGKLIVRAEAIYTVAGDTAPDNVGEFDSDDALSGLTGKFFVNSFKKRIEKEADSEADSDAEKTLNRIYLFLPSFSAVEFEKIYVTADAEHLYEMYVVVQDNTVSMTVSGFIDIKETGAAKEVELYTNIAGDRPISLREAENRLYHLTVTVYEADYGEDNSKTTPDPGEELLRLDSSKSE